MESQIYQKLIQINRKVEAIKKDRKNKEQGYSFRGIDDAYNMLHDLFADAGVVVLPKFLDSTREERRTAKGTLLIYTIATYEFHFVAKDGSEAVIILRGEGMDAGDKSLNKAFSAALKYALLSMFLIPTDDPKDSEIESHEVVPAPAPALAPIPEKAKIKIPEKAFAQLCDKLKSNPNPTDRGNLLAKTRRYYLPLTDQQESIIREITDNL